MRRTKSAQTCLHRIFRQGYGYKRAGVYIHEIVAENAAQNSLFISNDERMRRQRIMQTIDNINQSRNTHDCVHVGSYRPISSFVRHERDSSHRQNAIIDILRTF